MTPVDLLDYGTFAGGLVVAGFLFGLGFLCAFEVVDAIKARWL